MIPAELSAWSSRTTEMSCVSKGGIRRGYQAGSALQGDDGDALAAFLSVRGGIGAHQRVVGKLLTNGLAQRAGALAMQNAHERHAGQIRVVEVAIYLWQHFLHPLAAHVELEIRRRDGPQLWKRDHAARRLRPRLA